MDKIFRKFWVNFTLSFTNFKIKFVKFKTNFEKNGIFAYSFMKRNIKLMQKKLPKINFLKETISVSPTNFKKHFSNIQDNLQVNQDKNLGKFQP